MAKRLFYGSPNRIMQFIESDLKAASIYEIANTIFMLEKRVKDGKPIPKEVILNTYISLTKAETDRISLLLNILVSDVLLENIKFTINFKKIEKKTLKRNFKQCQTICLFSGGVDSTIGILNAKEKYNNIIGLYVAHQDTGKINSKVEKLKKEILDPSKIPFEKLIAPKMGTGYSQTRGFLYLLYAGLISQFTESKRIIISECGATMYQPKFAPFDTITYTTNPYVLQIAKTILQIIIKRELEIITPFEDFTKTEFMTLMPKDSILSKTHSCITGRWDQNCGVCYACITRMIGSVNLNLSLNYFRANVFQKRDNENLNSLLNFCINYLFNKESLDFWSFRSIENFGKTGLFIRVCEDTFLAMYKLFKKNKMHVHYEFILEDYLNQVGEKRLQLRDKELSKKKEPNYKKHVGLYKI